jgi:hypothetical protein
MRWGYRASTKPTADQEAARKIALDAFDEGKIALGKSILENARTKLSKPQAKKIARLLASRGQFDAATEVLVLSNWSEKAAKEELAPAPTAKVGDILYTSGGYEQTNVDYYEVVAVSGASATVRPISSRIVADHQYSVEVVPVPGSFTGPPVKKRVQKSSGGRYEIKISEGRGHAWLWDGKPKTETASGYGH